MAFSRAFQENNMIKNKEKILDKMAGGVLPLCELVKERTRIRIIHLLSMRNRGETLEIRKEVMGCQKRA